MNGILISLFSCLLLTSNTNGIELTTKQITPYLKLTYVHGGADAQMTHSKAREFCLKLSSGTNTTQAEGLNSTTSTLSPVTTTDSVANATSTMIPRTHSDLVSIHDPSMVHELMSWILRVEKRQFWIGGLLSKVREPFLNRQIHLIHAWTDGTPANYRFLHFSSVDLDNLRVGGAKCLSVDFASGKWGAHDCSQIMYFVCETVIFPQINEKSLPGGVDATSTVKTTSAPLPKTTVTSV